MTRTSGINPGVVTVPKESFVTVGLTVVEMSFLLCTTPDPKPSLSVLTVPHSSSLVVDGCVRTGTVVETRTRRP